MSSLERISSSRSIEIFEHPSIILPETSPVGVRLILDSRLRNERLAYKLAAMSADELNPIIARHIEVTGNDDDYKEHNEWLVDHKTTRLIRKIEHFVAGVVESKDDQKKTNEPLVIPLQDYKYVPWSQIEPAFRDRVTHSISRLIGVEHQPLPYPENGQPSELQLGWLAIKNLVTLDLEGFANTSIYDFARV